MSSWPRLQNAILRRVRAGSSGDEVLELFGAGSFIPTEAAYYDQIEEIGRDLGLVN